jgi:hypothetical protein
MSDSPREIQRYLNQPLDVLMQEFDLYAEQSAGMMKGLSTAWEKIAPALKHKVCNGASAARTPVSTIRPTSSWR